MGVSYSKTECAEEQLNWAIRLLVDHNAPIPALTLAGAAEEVLGRGVQVSAYARLKQTLMETYGFSGQRAQELLNGSRNWLKHWDRVRDSEVFEWDARAEAIRVLFRCVSNFVSLHGRVSPEFQRFLDWMEVTGVYALIAETQKLPTGKQT